MILRLLDYISDFSKTMKDVALMKSIHSKYGEYIVRK